MPIDNTPPPSIEDAFRSLSLQDTPHSQGTSSHFASDVYHLRQHLAPFLQMDLKDSVTIPIEKFVSDILHFAGSIDTSVIRTSNYQRALAKYCKSWPEKHRYHPFVLLAEQILLKVTTNRVGITYCRNDPTPIKGARAKRSPDIIGAYHQTVHLSQRDSVDNLAEDGPTEAPFWWPELLTYVEQKLHKQILTFSFSHDLRLGSSSPPAKDDPPSFLPYSRPQVSETLRSRSSLKRPRSLHPTPVQTPTISLDNSPEFVDTLSESPSKRKRLSTAPDSLPRTIQTRSMNRSSTATSSLSPAQSSPSVASRSPSVKSRVSQKNVNAPIVYSDPMVQCASYALELLSWGGVRSHVIGCLVTDKHMKILYHDRSITIVSESFDFVADGECFTKVLTALANLTASQWGLVSLDPDWGLPLPSMREEDVFNGRVMRLANGCVVEFRERLFHQHGLIGRGTCVVRATCTEKGPGADPAWDNSLVVKFSWPAKSRTPEPEFLAEIYKFAKAKAEDNWVLKHLPNLLHWEDRSCNVLSQALIELLGDKYEARDLRIMIFEELRPITELKTASYVRQSFVDVFKCKFHITMRCTLTAYTLYNRLRVGLRNSKGHPSGHQSQQLDVPLCGWTSHWCLE
jgi:hypothetical protein